MNSEYIQIENKNGVDYVTLNRPESLNALNESMLNGLRDYFEQLYFNHEVRVVVLKGSGKSFCAGLDLDSFDADFNSSAALKQQREISKIIILMRRCPQPIISLIQGSACGGGFALALASDIRIASEDMKMNAAFIKIGLSGCDVGVSYLLPRIVGASVASELLLTGRFIKANRALQTGLVSEVAASNKLEDIANKLVEEMLATSPLGLRLTKECLSMNIDAASLEQAIAMEDRNQVLCLQTKDFNVCLNAFLKNERPIFSDS